MTPDGPAWAPPVECAADWPALDMIWERALRLQGSASAFFVGSVAAIDLFRLSHDLGTSAVGDRGCRRRPVSGAGPTG